MKVTCASRELPGELCPPSLSKTDSQDKRLPEDSTLGLHLLEVDDGRSYNQTTQGN